jgi:hypothetical protein
MAKFVIFSSKNEYQIFRDKLPHKKGSIENIYERGMRVINS